MPNGNGNGRVAWWIIGVLFTLVMFFGGWALNGLSERQAVLESSAQRRDEKITSNQTEIATTKATSKAQYEEIMRALARIERRQRGQP